MLTLKNVKYWLFRLVVIFLPFGTGMFYTHIVDADVLYAFDIILFALYAIWIVERKSAARGGLIFNSFCTTSVLKIFWSTLSILPAISQLRGGIGVFILVKSFLIYFYFLNHIRDRRTLDMVVHWLMVGLCFQGVVGVLQYVSGKSLGLGFLGERQMSFHRTLSRVRGTLGYPNQFGAFIVMIIPVAFSLFVFTQRGMKKLFYGVTALFGLLALMLSFSRSAWAGLLIATACFVFIMAKKRQMNIRLVIASGVVLAAIGVLIIAFWDLILLRFETGSDPKYRIRMIEIALPMIEENPLLGVGLYNYEFHSMSQFRFWHPVHNDYLRLAAETGIPGFILFLGIIFFSLRQCVRMQANRDRFLFALALGSFCGMMALLVAISFGPEYQNYRVKMLYWVLAALMYAIPRVVAHTEAMKRLRDQKLQQQPQTLQRRGPATAGPSDQPARGRP